MRREPDTRARRIGRRTGVVGVACLCAVLAAQGGCYRRVVGARGIGATGVQTQEPTPPSLLDRLIGPAPQQPSDERRMRVN